ncbi:hypothetical protein BP6252_09435 [Coleophoma cylindrospora]|uniref:Uncharacterized protein n=1 Tax=Coleophoma cylindrospora TaxID=1849047 RepID=A0A3D8R1W9_9HELO|nr:hypothetical protein BP6252_09435 [Coleophoma cylindrospora]
MAARLSGVLKWFSSSAPEAKPSSPEIPLTQVDGREQNGDPDEQNGERSPSYQDAIEYTQIEDDHADAPLSTPVSVAKKRKEKKGKKGKKRTAKTVPELETTQDTEMQEVAADDTDLPAHMGKVGDITTALEVGSSTGAKKARRSKGSLSKSDLKVLKENHQRELVGDEGDAVAKESRQVPESPINSEISNRSRAPIATPAKVQESNDDDYEALLHNQLSPAKQQQAPETLSPIISDTVMDDRLDQPEPNVSLKPLGKKQKKKKRSLSISESQAETIPKSKRTKVSETGKSDIKAMLSSQQVAKVLGQFEKETHEEFKQGGLVSPSSSRVVVVLPSMSASTRHETSSSQKTPKTRKVKNGFTPVNPQQTPEVGEEEQEGVPVTESGFNAEPTSQPKPPPKRAHKKASRAQEVNVTQSQELDGGKEINPHPGKIARKKSHKNIESEPQLENGEPSPPKSASRQKRRLPTDDTEEEAVKLQAEQKTKASKTIKAPFSGNVHSKMTPHDVELLSNAVATYEGMYNLTHDELITMVHDDANKQKQLWNHIGEAVSHLNRRKVLAFVRRSYHNFQKGPWTEQEDEDLERVYNRAIENRTGQKLWLEIQTALNRYAEDCRDRWRTYSTCKNRKTGLWSQEEEERLRKIVEHCKGLSVEANRAAGKGSLVLAEVEPNWSIVAKMMDGTRTRLSCYNKWMNIQQREKESHDPIAEAPVTSTPWRAVQALDQARSLSKDEKIAILSYISTSGAATEGKIPWKVFTMRKAQEGNVLTYRVFLRAALNTLSDDDFPSMQDKISELLKMLHSNTSLAIEYDRLGIPKRQRRPRAEGYKLSRNVIMSDDEANLTSEDELEPSSSMRRRMKKIGESQETVADDSNDDADEDIAGIFEGIKSSHKKSSKKREKIVAKEDPMDYEQESSYLVEKSKGAKKAKKSKALPAADIDGTAKDSILLQRSPEDKPTEAPTLKESTVSASAKEKKKKSKKEKKATMISEKLSQEQEQVDQESEVSVDLNAMVKKNRRGKQQRESLKQADNNEAIPTSDNVVNIQASPAIEDRSTDPPVERNSTTAAYPDEAIEDETPEETEQLSEEHEENQEDDLEEIAEDGEDWRRMSANMIPRYEPEQEEEEEVATPDPLEDPIEGSKEYHQLNRSSASVDSHHAEDHNQDQSDATSSSDRDEIDDDAQDAVSFTHDKAVVNDTVGYEAVEDDSEDSAEDSTASHVLEEREITTFGLPRSHLNTQLEASPELQGTPREIRESSQILEAFPASKENKPRKRFAAALEEEVVEETQSSQSELLEPRRKEKNKRKGLLHEDDESERRVKRKKRVNVSEAQEIWNSFQPHTKKTVNGDRLQSNNARNNAKRSFVLDQAAGDTDSGSDSSIPAVKLPKALNNKTNGRMKTSGFN